VKSLTVVCLGDSTTAGTPLFKSPVEAPPSGQGDERSQFAYWLRRKHPEWRVLNCGVNGERSDEIAERFDRDVLANAPDVVVIIAGVNDVYQGRSVEHVTSHLKSMYARARTADIPVVAGTIVAYNTATPEQNQKMRDINRWIADQPGLDGNVAWADTRSSTASTTDPDKLAGSPDGLHPDVDGYRRMAEVLAPAIVTSLKSC
jgi:lysophospholipase L1-like esterase